MSHKSVSVLRGGPASGPSRVGGLRLSAAAPGRQVELSGSPIAPSRDPGGKLEVAPTPTPPTTSKPRRQIRTNSPPAPGSPKQPWYESSASMVNCVHVTTPMEYLSALGQAQRDGLVTLVYFLAPWCRACRAIHPKVVHMARDVPEVLVIKFNTSTEDMRAQASEMGVDRLPMFHVHKGEELVSSFTANLNTVDRLRQEVTYHAAAAPVP